MTRIIGILTGGGDVPGLNPAMKAMVTIALDNGIKVYGIRHGWAGLLEYDLNNPESQKNIYQLSYSDIRTIDRSGGTFLHTSRTNPQRVK
ncbi:MAG TPA: 6-phosphofructokinase, partial [Flexilinea sp.]|nr:6-phosphofructokinase [Flexilinea sp.]